MLSRIVALLSVCALALGSETTRTRLQCSTRMGTFSLDRVPRHTVTKTVIAPNVTIAFTSHPCEIVTPSQVDQTQFSVATRTSTITEKLTGDVFTTTVTHWEKHVSHVNATMYFTISQTSYDTSTFVMPIPTVAGWRPINGSTSATSSLASATPSASYSSTAATATEPHLEIRVPKSTMGVLGAMNSRTVFPTLVQCR